MIYVTLGALTAAGAMGVAGLMLGYALGIHDRHDIPGSRRARRQNDPYAAWMAEVEADQEAQAADLTAALNLISADIDHVHARYGERLKNAILITGK